MTSESKQVPPICVLSRRDRVTIPQIPAHSGPAIDSLFEVLKRHNATPAGSLLTSITIATAIRLFHLISRFACRCRLM